MLMLGTLLSPADALDVGLVDELVPSTAALTSAATYRMRTLLDVNDGARRSTKEMLRREAADALVSRISEDTNDFVRMVSSESVQGEIKAYLELLKEKNKAN
jgi:enoyl-CoA hydratase/carnithine racemase|tara:strand:+ start:664 stop:969 length:306 start_codon:yes stop_codon:yes gene_type:complete